MKKLRCKKEWGAWFYEKIMPTDENELDAPVYSLTNEDKTETLWFGSYNDMMFYVQTGIILA